MSINQLLVLPAGGMEPLLQRVPMLIVQEGENAKRRFLEFFTAQIRNPNTRAAYLRDVRDFFTFCELNRLELSEIEPIHVAAWIELCGQRLSPPTAKRRLSAVKHLFDWLVTGQIVPHNPAASVRGPKHQVATGKTPVLTSEETRQILDSIPSSSVVGLRDRALIGVMAYSFARISAVLKLDVLHYTPRGKRWWLIFAEKGGKHHEVPCHHLLEQMLDAYIDAAGIAQDRRSPLFRSVDGGGRSNCLSASRLDRQSAWAMVRRSAQQAGILTPIGNHSFRATGITNFLQNGGSLETAQRIAGHASPRTTRLYDRRADELALSEIERVRY